MSGTPEHGGESNSRTTRWRVREIVSPEVRGNIDQTQKELAAHGGSRHPELSVRLDRVARLQVPVLLKDQPNRAGPGHESTSRPDRLNRWVIVPPLRDPAMQKRAWNCWLETINSMRGEPRPSTRTMTVQRGTNMTAVRQ